MAYIKETETGVRYMSAASGTTPTMPLVPATTSLSWMDYLHGVHNPKWRRTVRRHGNASTDMQARKFVVTAVPGVFYGERWMRSNPLSKSYIWRVGAPFGGASGVFLAGSVPAGTAVNDAAERFYADVRNKMSAFKGSTFSAESREAKKMMHDRARRMLGMIPGYLSTLKRRWYGRGAKRHRLKRLADSWLELQFGWLPLISDIKDANHVLNNPGYQYRLVKGSAQNTAPVALNTLSWGVGAGVGTGSFRETTTYSVKYYGELWAREQPTGSVLQDFGLTVREFVPTAWEVIPWSFAVDYFTNIGSILTAASYASANFSRKSMVTRMSRTRQSYMSCDVIPPNATFDARTYINIPATFEATATETFRQASVEVPIPGLSWRLPSFKQGLNLAALAVSRRLKLFNT